MIEIAGGVLVLTGVVISIAGAFGVLRLRDVFTRVHAASLCDTGAALLIAAGLGLLAGFGPIFFKIFFIWLFLTLTAPVASHALMRAAAADRRDEASP